MPEPARPTPGPWFAWRPGNFVIAGVLDDDPATGRIVAEVACQSGNPADLPLIAAAPELRDALRRLTGILREAPVAVAAASYGADLAIAKAEALLARLDATEPHA